MEPVHCTLCVKKCLPKEEITLGLDLNNPPRVNKDEDALKNELPVIFLLRKILEIPQEVCRTFLTEYGDPCSWIDFCNSCLDLVQKGKVVFDQMTMFKKQFKTLQNQIKDQMIDIQMERKLDEGKRIVKERIRYYINPGISSVGNIAPKEVIFHDRSSSEETTSESTCLLVAANNAKDVFVKTEIIDSLVDPLNALINQCDEFGHYSEEMNSFGLLENGKDGVNNCESEKMQDSVYVKMEQIKLEQDFLPETTDVNFSTFSYVSNEHSEVAKSPTYIIPQIIKETNSNPNSRQDKNERGFGCEICGKHFQTNHNLNVHKRIHTGKNPYKCDICGDAFVSHSGLTGHLVVHVGAMSYKCDICGKEFPKKNILNQHKTRHTVEKRHKCEYCEKAYAASTGLKLHLLTHTGVKLCKCDICKATFSSPSILRRHKALHNK